MGGVENSTIGATLVVAESHARFDQIDQSRALFRRVRLWVFYLLKKTVARLMKRAALVSRAARSQTERLDARSVLVASETTRRG